MILRKQLIEKIIECNDIFVREVKSYNAIGAYDINIHAEPTLIPILNGVFDLELEWANKEKKNFPAVDLIDDKNGVAFQVTATTSLDKIISTLEKFIAHNLHLKYPILYIYVLTEKLDNYNAAKIKKVVDGKIEFDANSNIIDYRDILKRVNSIVSVEKISNIAKLYEHEFSPVQIKAREHKFKDGFLTNQPEAIYLNMVKVNFAQRIYIGTPLLDKKERIANINEQRKKAGQRPIKDLSMAKLIRHFLIENGVFDSDWIVRENKIITFHNLLDPDDSLFKWVDRGTVESFSAAEYYQISEDYEASFKDLLKRCLIEFCYTREMEWVGERQIIRFRNDRNMPREKKTGWRGKKDSTKTVIFEVMTKKTATADSHIVCFRSMAFKPTFYFLANQWFLCINPTWSFTNPGGFRTSRYESDYLAGILRLENNNTVCYQFRFFAHYLSHTPPLFVKQYSYLSIAALSPLEYTPSLADDKWLPPKEFSATSTREKELFLDNELNSNMF